MNKIEWIKTEKKRKTCQKWQGQEAFARYKSIR